MPRILPVLAALALTIALDISGAAAQSIVSRTDTAPYPGVTVAEIRTSSPATNVWAAFIDLCHDYVHVDATAPTTSRRSTGAFGDAIGAQLAVNGDFYRTDPILRVYGDAVGGGVEWPTNQTGTDPGYSWEWFYQSYGWIAFGPDWVEFNHTEWVKASSGLELRGSRSQGPAFPAADPARPCRWPSPLAARFPTTL